jgi:PAS domain S-box-containing protein
MESRDKKEYRPTYALILIFLLLSAGISAAGYLSYRNYSRHYRLEVERQLSAIADLKVRELAQWRKERLGDTGPFYGNEAFSSLVRRHFIHPNDIKVRRQIWTWLSKTQLYYSYKQLLLFDARGALRMSVPDSEAPVAPSLSKRAAIVMRSEQIDFQDFYRDELDQQIYLTIMIPILSKEDGGQALGTLVLRIDPETYLYPFVRRWPTPSKTAETLLVRREGSEVVFLNDLRFREKSALNLRFPLERKYLPAVRAVLGHEGIVEDKDYRDVQVIAAVRKIPDSPWFLVTRMDISEIYGPLQERLWMIIIFVIALLVGIGAGIGLIWRRQHLRSYREKYEAATALQKSEEKYRRIFETTIEGIYQTTPKGRYLSVNPAFAFMLGYASPEDLIDSITDIGAQVYVDPDRRSEIKRLLSEQGIVKDFEAQLYRKDGTTMWSLINAMAVRDEKGDILCYQGGMMDITSRRQAEEELRGILERLRKSIATTIQVMVSAVEARDPYTAGHQIRSADLARSIATEMGLSQEKIDGIRMAGSIHDIGKLSIPAEILSKPTKLTNIEFSLIKEHSRRGYEMLQNVESPWPLAEIIYQHHERMDGSGYPRGLKGDEILMEARIMAVADVVEAMASHRPYRPAIGIDAALNEIEKNRGVFYDKVVADACMRLFREKGFKLEGA